MKIVAFLALLLSFSCTAQEPYIAFELRFENPEQQKQYSPFDSTIISVVLRNNSPCPYKVFETWNTWGYYTLGFEIIADDRVYPIRHQKKIWFRNFASMEEIAPGDSAVFSFNLRDSAYVDDIFEGAWVGLPEHLNGPSTIRFRYELSETDAQVTTLCRQRLNDYIDYLEGDIEDISEVQATPTHDQENPACTCKYVDEDLLLGTFYSDPIPIEFE